MPNGLGTPPDWANTPRMDSTDFHAEGGQSWKYDARGVFLQNAPTTPLRTHGDPTTVTAILASYGSAICKASVAHQIPPELIVMTIAVETASNRADNFTGPKTFRWEPSQGSYSGGPMQVLETTSREIIKQLHLDFQPGDIPPHFSSKPVPPPSINPLYDGDLNIPLGTGFIRLHKARTGLDPILVAANFNHGSLGHSTPTQVNPWGLITAGDHLNRAAAWYGDACAVLSDLRNGRTMEVGDVIPPSPIVEPPGHPAGEEVELNNLTPEVAQQEKEFYEDSGATVIEIPEEGGFVTLVVTYDKPAEPPPEKPTAPTTEKPAAPGGQAPGTAGVQAPNLDGYVFCIDRTETQKRRGAGFDRTVGRYQAFFNRQPIADISGIAVERQGPGDNTQSGVQIHRRIAPGTYPLSTHAGGGRYGTFGFANPGGIRDRPWPCLLVMSTGARTGILIHCAAGYLMSTGCINLTGRPMKTGDDDIAFNDSKTRVMALIQSMKSHLGSSFPSFNAVKIQNAFLVVRGDPPNV